MSRTKGDIRLLQLFVVDEDICDDDMHSDMIDLENDNVIDDDTTTAQDNTNSTTTTSDTNTNTTSNSPMETCTTSTQPTTYNELEQLDEILSSSTFTSTIPNTNNNIFSSILSPSFMASLILPTSVSLESISPVNTNNNNNNNNNDDDNDDHITFINNLIAISESTSTLTKNDTTSTSTSTTTTTVDCTNKNNLSFDFNFGNIANGVNSGKDSMMNLLFQPTNDNDDNDDANGDNGMLFEEFDLFDDFDDTPTATITTTTTTTPFTATTAVVNDKKGLLYDLSICEYDGEGNLVMLSPVSVAEGYVGDVDEVEVVDQGRSKVVGLGKGKYCGAAGLDGFGGHGGGEMGVVAVSSSAASWREKIE
ncbi:hypothetical protein HDU76_008517, partial [Blyttiomyces sp. JEL0837]